MAKRIFASYGIEVFQDLFGYKITFENAGHGGGLRSIRVDKLDAEKAMSGPDAAAEVLDRLA